MEDSYKDDYPAEVKKIFKRAEGVLNDNAVGLTTAIKYFRKSTIEEVEANIRQLENDYTGNDAKYIGLLNIIKKLLNIIKYDKLF